ncbi:hypothetical protein [Celeribacter sp.]|uniref:hypothetical protein n=1 Tax=Celeribacter sp. TaxID=1890673 RepID=UPI003A93D6CF
MASEESEPPEEATPYGEADLWLREEEGFTGGYTTVKDYVRGHRQKAREMFIPLSHPPGHGQADFGEALVILNGAEQKIHFFAFDLPYSDAC